VQTWVNVLAEFSLDWSIVNTRMGLDINPAAGVSVHPRPAAALLVLPARTAQARIIPPDLPRRTAPALTTFEEVTETVEFGVGQRVVLGEGFRGCLRTSPIDVLGYWQCAPLWYRTLDRVRGRGNRRWKRDGAAQKRLGDAIRRCATRGA
jgi:hypothetical protein